MHCQLNQETTVVDVKPCAEVHAELPRNGILRFERKGGAMAGNPAMGFDEDGVIALYFADGASLHLGNTQA